MSLTPNTGNDKMLESVGKDSRQKLQKWLQDELSKNQVK